MQLNTKTSEIENTLKQWGLWARLCDDGFSTLHPIAVMIEKNRERDEWTEEREFRVSVSISDREAIQVDQIICQSH